MQGCLLISFRLCFNEVLWGKKRNAVLVYSNETVFMNSKGLKLIAYIVKTKSIVISSIIKNSWNELTEKFGPRLMSLGNHIYTFDFP